MFLLRNLGNFTQGKFDQRQVANSILFQPKSQIKSFNLFGDTLAASYHFNFFA